MDMRTEFLVRFGYGAIVPWVTKLDDKTVRAIAGPDMVVLRSPVGLTGRDMKHIGEFTVTAGETVPFVMTYGESHQPPPDPLDHDAALTETETFWTEWAAKCKQRRASHRRRAAFPDHAEGFDLLADRRHRCSADHVAAGAAGRRTQLGLPLLLAARRDADAARSDERRLLRRSAGLARLAACAPSPAARSNFRSCTGSAANAA